MFNHQPLQGLDNKWFCKRVLMKTLLCAFLYPYVYENVCSLLSASERQISLIEAHRRPSTPRPRGIAAETHNKYYSNTHLSETILERISK